MRLAKTTKGRYWSIFKTVSLVADGRKYHRQELIISLKGSIPKEEAMALLKDLEEGKAEVRKDRFGHKYVYELARESNKKLMKEGYKAEAKRVSGPADSKRKTEARGNKQAWPQ